MLVRRAIVIMLSAALAALSGRGGARAESDPLSDGLQNVMFLTSGYWYQMTGDRKEGVFRLYAVVMDEQKRMLDMPNLMVLKCRERTPYLTIHFPKNYRFRSFSDTSWLQETRLFARNERSTYKFPAELNNNEIYVDLEPEARENLRDLFADRSMELRFGPDGGDRIVLFEGADLFKTESGMLAERLADGGRKIEKTFPGWDAIGACVRP